MEKNLKHVIRCCSSGEIEINIDVLNELYGNGESFMAGIDDSVGSYRFLLDCADIYLSHGYDSEAHDRYDYVFRHVSWNPEGDEVELFDRSYKGLLSLNSSDDECVWEESSQLVSDFMRRCRENASPSRGGREEEE